MNSVLTITGKNKYATIKREKLADGYNYYISVFIKGFDNFYYLADHIKQDKSIFSLREADQTARNLLDTI